MHVRIVFYLLPASGKTTREEVYTYSYDYADRVSKVEHTLGGTKITLADYTYDSFGRLSTKSLHGSAANKLTYAYNLRSWLTGITSTRFTQNLYYNTGVGTARYNGNISSMTWKSGNESTVRGYKFTYDGLDRMLNATYGETAGISTNANRFSENVTGYDKNGNIKGLQRYGQLSSTAYGMIDNLTLTLNGNQLNRVDDAVAASTYNGGFEFKNGANAADEYSYDANGNLTKDLNKGISGITYNFLNLPNAVTFSDGSTITYTYGADGTKLRTVHKIGSTTTTTDYCGNVVYENGVQKLLLTEEGYVTLSDSKYHYYLKDHQGNNRVVISQSGTVEETNHYYPFGGAFASTSNVQPYKYNGKELDSKKGLNWYDYGARHYDAALGRFTTNDRFAEKYYSMSPYQYGANNPVNNIDVNGDTIVVNPNPNGLIDNVRIFFGFDTKYQKDVKADLQQLKKDDKEIGEMIIELEKSKNVHSITRTKRGKSNSSGFDREKAKKDIPQGSIINYDPDVKACNSQGIWSPNVKELKIKILPPWWRTWWAYTIYSGIVLCILLSIIRNLRLRQKQKQIMQAIEVENERQQKINNMKLQFFANISHELRTPLSLIINPLEEFFVDHPEYRKGILDMVKQNADYLLELINQLLDFRKLDAKAETLKCKHDNILIILSEIFHSFDPIAQKRNISYSLTAPQHSVFMDFDYDKIRKICTNILSNAFKFTPNKGSISLDIAVRGTNLELTFTDTGCGIEDEAKEKIFQRFYQSGKNQSNNGGSGIGLHIVSEYVKMHQGTVCVRDNQPCGSVFLIALPLHQNSNETKNGEPVEGPEIKEESHPFTILLVDDNYDFLKFLSESLARQYHVLKATNGKHALNVLEKEDIDLVVSDIMMPEMDGLELCSTIKNDIRYSHIPIILLTAKASEEHQLEGLSVGADDYITKPFNMEVLKLRINKIIEMNVKRQEIFNQDIKIEPSRITITPLDQQLVEKALQIVEDNISETEFSVEELASSLNISRSYFYKKMIKITGKKPIEFIRTIRMKRAQQLLTESQMQVSEIAYTLGYNSPKIFSKHFKEEFNISPSEFIRQQAE